MTNGGFLCIKQDMTQLLLENSMEAVTLLQFLDQEIIRIKTEEKDWYNAIVLWALKKEKDNSVSYRYIREFKVDSIDWYNVWDVISFDILKDIKTLTLKATTKWRWYQWVVKRFGFGWGRATHGSKFHRHPWGIGNRKPRRVNKNHPLPGHMGTQNVTVKNVNIIDTHTIENENIIVVKWSVPGSRNWLIRMYL